MSNLCGGGLTKLVEIGRWDVAGTYTFMPDFDGDAIVYLSGAGGTGYNSWGTSAKGKTVLYKVQKNVEISLIVGDIGQLIYNGYQYGNGGTTSFGNILALGGSTVNRLISFAVRALEYGIEEVISHGILTPFGENPPNGKRGFYTGGSNLAQPGIVIIYREETI